MALDVSFDYDFDSDNYMLSKDPDAKDWKVIIHSENGESYVRSIEKFSPYPGCTTHEGEAAWSINCYRPDTIEIQQPGQEPVILKHPDR